MENLRVFALESSKDFGASVCSHLGIPLSKLEESRFADGESKIRSLTNVRNCHAFVIQAAYQDDYENVDSKLMKLLFLIKGLRQAWASNITVVLPYFPYARSDRKVKPREVVATQGIAELIEGVGATGVLTMDIHNLGAYQNAFRIRNDNLEGRPLFAKYLVDHEFTDVNPNQITILSPDAGGMGRANRLRVAVSHLMKINQDTISIAHLDKVRVDGKVKASRIVGLVTGQHVVVMDDMIGSGSTIKESILAAHKEKSKRIIAVATHGVFIDANKNLEMPELEKLIITNTIEPFRLSKTVLDKTIILDTAATFAEAIRRMECGESLSSLMEY